MPRKTAPRGRGAFLDRIPGDPSDEGEVARRVSLVTHVFGCWTLYCTLSDYEDLHTTTALRMMSRGQTFGTNRCELECRTVVSAEEGINPVRTICKGVQSKQLQCERCTGGEGASIRSGPYGYSAGADMGSPCSTHLALVSLRRPSKWSARSLASVRTEIRVCKLKRSAAGSVIRGFPGP